MKRISDEKNESINSNSGMSNIDEGMECGVFERVTRKTSSGFGYKKEYQIPLCPNEYMRIVDEVGAQGRCLVKKDG